MKRTIWIDEGCGGTAYVGPITQREARQGGAADAVRRR
jgi:hypothetical protein